MRAFYVKKSRHGNHDGLSAKQGLFAELLNVSPTLLGVGFALVEKFLGVLRIDDRELRETGLVHNEIAEFGEIGLFAVDLQWALALSLEARIESPSGEVAAIDSHLLLFDRVH